MYYRPLYSHVVPDEIMASILNAKTLASSPGSFCIGREKEPGTHCLHVRQITGVGLQGISIFSNIEVPFFKGTCSIAFLVNTVIPYIAILSATLAFFSKKVSLTRSILQLPQ